MGVDVPDSVNEALEEYLEALRAHERAVAALIDGHTEISRDDLVRLDESFGRLDVAESTYRDACARRWG